MSDSLINKGDIAQHAAAESIDRSAYLPATPWLQLMLVCCLFALWGMAGNLNDILIAQFKKGFDLSDTQTALVQSIFFLGYFVMALPAAAVIKRYSYKVAIVIGLCLYALGCFLFIPAAQIMTYGAFLACLGVIATGLSFLETSANTYSSLLGPLETSTQRINFSQIFNSLGIIFGVLIGQQLVFGKNDPSHAELLQMSAAAAEAARTQMVSQVVTPYLIIGSVLIVLALIFVAVKFPACKTQRSYQGAGKPLMQSLKILLALPRFRLGVLSQFLYVGAQVGLWSFTIRFVQMIEQGATEHSATYWLLATLVCYSAGKVVTTALMKKFSPARLLGVFCSVCVLLLLLAVNIQSLLAVVAIMGVNFCMALCWPTNFGLTIKGLGEETQVAGSIVVMSIIGGAVVPLIMGIISDLNGGDMQIAFAVPLVCFAYVAFYGFYCARKGI
ncbi:L-fucose:H+ symporter permease [Serratia marcescens]|uniref:L-fucose:H+ symporter permease n=1 Tax=Serratia marcescens TaxID=615 RepID=UPI0018D7596A|nr:L-fucose:H+ symporter permease [Serratia marcescens]MBH3125624.1 L-fucose:H+ symporter permease [Serratia marcescens]MBS3890144.1 L-fucose:H+ symporter permease [Serratia marcescens]MEE4612306.1 L-fucose:H+ symporter permease [Serratia marcescens]HDG0627828.1 L-fucose:H+ symporter permease [Serratia marcescens]